MLQTTTATSVVGNSVRPSVRQRVKAYQNPELIERFKQKLGLGHTDAELLFEDLKKFLYIAGTNRGSWPPPVAIDDAWHEFILYTKDYRTFCLMMFDRMIDHTPTSYFGPAEKLSARGTINEARQTFGGLSANWKGGASCTGSDGVPCSGTTNCQT